VLELRIGAGAVGEDDVVVGGVARERQRAAGDRRVAVEPAVAGMASTATAATAASAAARRLREELRLGSMSVETPPGDAYSTIASHFRRIPV